MKKIFLQFAYYIDFLFKICVLLSTIIFGLAVIGFQFGIFKIYSQLINHNINVNIIFTACFYLCYCFYKTFIITLQEILIKIKQRKLKTFTYIGIINGEEGKYGVFFPDFLGCISAGSNLEELMKNSKEALLLHTEGMIEDGEKLPKPSSLEKIKKTLDETLKECGNYRGYINISIDRP